MLSVVYVAPVVYVPHLKDLRPSACFSVSYGFLAVIKNCSAMHFIKQLD